MDNKDIIRRFSVSKNIKEAVLSQIPKDALYIMMIGFADGSLVRELRDALPSMIRLFIWEPDEKTFSLACRNADIEDLLHREQIDIVVGRDKEKIKSAIEKGLEKHNVNHAISFCIPGFSDLYESEESLLKELFEEAAFKLRMDAATNRYMAERTCRNQLIAMSFMHQNSTVDQLMKRIPTRELPVILVASGPSLKKNVHLLKEVSDKALIVAAAHSAAFLKKQGVDIHFALMLDAFGGSHFMDHDTESSTRMLLDARCVPEIQRKYNGNIVYSWFDQTLFPVSGVDYRLFEYSSGGSVMTNAFSMFRNAGFKNIILVGQDLAFDEDGYSHMNQEMEERGKTADPLMIEGIDGNQVMTRDDWLMFLLFFEDEISKHPEVNVIDATEGGALIHGSKVMPLKEAIDTYCVREYPLNEWIDCLPKVCGGDQKEILEIIQRRYRDAQIMQEKLETVCRINRLLHTHVSRDSLLQGGIQKQAAEYDQLYTDITESENANLTLAYCDDILQEYIENALTVEGAGGVKDKLETEYALFTGMRERNREMLEFISQIFFAGDSEKGNKSEK